MLEGAGLREIEQRHPIGRGLDVSEVLKTSGEERLAYNTEGGEAEKPSGPAGKRRKI